MKIIHSSLHGYDTEKGTPILWQHVLSNATTRIESRRPGMSFFIAQNIVVRLF